MHRASCPSVTVTMLLVAAWAGGGCTNPRTAARPAALLVLDHVESYGAGLEAEIRLQEEYYRNTNRVLKDDARRRVISRQSTDRLLAVHDFADTILLEQHGVPVGRLQRFLVETDERFDQALLRQMQSEAEAAAAAAASFAKLSFDAGAVEDIRGELVQVTRDPSAAEQARRLFAFGQEVKKELDRLKKEQEKNKPATQPAPAPTTGPTTSPVQDD
jgi:hypothetical protein